VLTDARPPGEPQALIPAIKPSIAQSVRTWMRDFFLGDDPSFFVALVPYCLLSMLLFTRHPRTNFIFDEQEALLANPYVRSVADAHPKFGWLDAFKRDFWGLGPERSIGSYRPIPNLVWRALWALGLRDTPFLHHWINVLLHGVNGALVCVLAFKLTKRRGTAWVAGACFTACGVLTEAVSGVVGIADVLGATGAILALLALTLDLAPMAIAVFVASLFGLYSKESALCVVPLVPLAAFMLAQTTHPNRPLRLTRGLASFFSASGAFLLYVETRRRWFPAALPPELAPEEIMKRPTALSRTFGWILRWYAQPMLPKDPLNNPLVNASPVMRVGGALRVFFRGIAQIVFPWTLSGDYSAPQEPAPTTLASPEIILGALCLVVPFLLAAWWTWSSYRRFTQAKAAGETPALDMRPLVGFGLVWAVVSYFPVSNIPILLPTVRAERFWYTPVVGTSLALAVVFAWVWDSERRYEWRRGLMGFVAVFLVFQALAARLHANDYTDDLVFWDATRKAVPRSAKAHLNYSVMKGARGDLNARLAANGRALELAPEWPMASIYYGDTLCRLHRPEEAWPHYKNGFEKAMNDVNLIALAMQCLWDEKAIGENGPLRAGLVELKDDPKYKGSWVAFLADDIVEHGEEHSGVDPKYRPRGYNEGPKE
jgi:hypothetical protein